MLRDLANGIRPSFAPASWLIISNDEIVGLCSVVKMPADRAIHIGYGIAETRRRKGHASRAVAEIVSWARGDDRISTCHAETSVNNIASQRVLEANGFVRTGVRNDPEDGELICWLVPVDT